MPKRSKAELQAELSSEQYRVTQEKGTERPFTGRYWDVWRDGVYHCVCCDAPLFKSETKFDAGCGWPSFDQPIAGALTEHVDTTFNMVRTEVVCTACGAHLGHVFPDGPPTTGLRYCINSASLRQDGDDA
jgi:peptide-methionine (R)-S-oxide reductase